MERGGNLRRPEPTEDEPSQETPQELEGDDHRARVRPLMTGDDETEGHGGADLPAREGPEGGRHHCDRERMTKSGEKKDGLVRRGRGKDGTPAPPAQSRPPHHLP